MNPVLVDTSFFKALIDEHDDFYQQATALWKTFLETNTPLFITNYILDETFTLIRIKCTLTKALVFRELLKTKKLNLTIIRIKASDDSAAWEWFENDWSKLSYTDCVSFAVMKRLELTHVATFDTHFRRAGFTIVSPK